MQFNRNDVSSQDLSWVLKDDIVMFDADWFTEREYRLKKSLNEFVMIDAKSEGLLRVLRTTNKGQSMHLGQTTFSPNTWKYAWPLKIQLAHHSKYHPVMFVYRVIR